MFRPALASAVALVAPLMLHAQASRDRIALAEGRPTVLAGTIQGDRNKTYVLSARAGQRLLITLQTNNRSNYMNVTMPGAEAATFVGSIQGGRYDFVVAATGDYVIDVYLMRNAARRNEKASYKLSVAQH